MPHTWSCSQDLHLKHGHLKRLPELMDALHTCLRMLSTHTDLLVMVRDFMMQRYPLDMAGNSTALLNSIRSDINATQASTDPQALQDLLNSIFSYNGSDSSSSSTSGNNSSSSSGSSSADTGKRSLLQQQASPQPQPYQANDPLVRNNSQWYHSHIQSDVAWQLTKGAPS